MRTVHNHSFAPNLSYDANNHWYAATCGHDVTSGLEPHHGGTANCTSQAATFSVETTGDGLNYQWYIKHSDASGWKKLEGAIGATYITAETDLDCDGFQYGCRIGDQHGNTLQSDVAVLHVSALPELPETGDSATSMLWLAMSILSLAGILLLRRKAYRK